MRLRASVLGLLLMGVFSAPVIASAAVPFWGPIIPKDFNVCAANWSLVIVVINNIISLGITLAIAIVAPLSFAYAGFLLLTSQGDPGKRTQARNAIRNVIVGIVVALSSYLIVAALMAVLYHPDDRRLAGKTWADLVIFGGTPPCIELKASLNQTKTGELIVGRGDDGPVVMPPGTSTGFTYDAGITAQIPHQSGAVLALLSCMQSKLPAGVGRISSISDSEIVNGQHTFAQCAASRVCAHAPSSCHYGGSGSCNGSSYAVDFGDEENMTILTQAAQSCGAKTLDERDHLHVSVGSTNGCGCDVNL